MVSPNINRAIARDVTPPSYPRPYEEDQRAGPSDTPRVITQPRWDTRCFQKKMTRIFLIFITPSEVDHGTPGAPTFVPDIHHRWGRVLGLVSNLTKTDLLAGITNEHWCLLVRADFHLASIAPGTDDGRVR